MRSANSEQEIKIQATQGPVSRPAAWGRMLATSALLSLGLSSLSGCASIDANAKRSSILQPKEEVKVEQTVKNRVNCSKASKRVRIDEITRMFTVETCDDWSYVKTYFDDYKFITKSSLKIDSNFDGTFTERQIYIGDSNCRSFIVKGKSDTIRFFFVSDVVSVDDTSTTPIVAIDSGIIAPLNGLNLKVEQSSKTCGWRLEFIDPTQTYTILVDKKGNASELKPFNK